LRVLALSGLKFGVVGVDCVLYCIDMTPKKTNKVDVILEDDMYADKDQCLY
jgi:hypothetical protein